MINKLGILRSHSSLFNLLGQCVDAGIIAGGLVLASSRVGFPWNRDFTILGAAAIILHYLAGTRNGLYHSWRISSVFREVIAISKTWSTVLIGLFILVVLLDLGGPYFRRMLSLWLTASFACQVLCRGAVRLLLRIARNRGYNRRRVVIVGAGVLGARLAGQMRQSSWTGLEVIGFFDDGRTTADKIMGLPVLGTIDELHNYLSGRDIDSVYITLPFRADHKIRQILDECRSLGANLHVVPDLLSFSLYNLQLERFGDTILLNFSPHDPSKRMFDLCFSTCTLIAALPAMLLIALAVKLEDGGPVFYGQRRVTRAGKEFKCLKFRSMCVDADRKLSALLSSDPRLYEEWERTFKLRNDPRVTRVGRLLRKTSLDELPQFFNVLKGEMSVVGARPIVEKELCNYYKENGGLYCSMKPGITGAWQTARRSDTKNYAERVELDTWYVHNHSFLLDLKIILSYGKSDVRGKRSILTNVCEKTDRWTSR